MIAVAIAWEAIPRLSHVHWIVIWFHGAKPISTNAVIALEETLEKSHVQLIAAVNMAVRRWWTIVVIALVDKQV